MKKHIYLALMLISPLINAQVQVAWYNYPGGVAVATDASNNVYTANWDYNAAGDITLTKRDAAGNILWEVAYNNTDNTRHEVATWVETDNQGNILVSGTIRSGYSNPVNAASLLMKYSPAGTLLWRVVYESSFDGSSTRKCLVDANNNIYVLGIGTGPNGQVAKVKKFNSSGATVWNYFDSGIGAPITFKFTPDNNIVIVHRGITGSINGYSKISLNGNLIWSYSGVNSLSVGDAAGDSYGNTYIINGEYVVSNAGSIITKLSPSGTVIWSKTNTMKGSKVEVGTDNYPVVGGNPIIGYGVAFMKYDTNGNVLWQNLDADGPSLALLAIAPMQLDGQNAAYIAGSTMSAMGLCKVNSNGIFAWAATTPSGYPVWFEFGTDNSVYVTGGTTAKFTQSGSVPAPTAPSNLVAIISGTSIINLSWTDNSSNETSFILQRSLSVGSGFATIATLSSNVTTYSNLGLTSSTNYYYRVQAANSGGGSAWSNVANATTHAGPPASPSGLLATAAGTTVINLTWTDNASNETSYIIQRSLTSGSGFTNIVSLAANTISYSNTGLNSSTTYYYRLQALNSNGSSAWSNVANATTANAGLPTAPSNLTAKAIGCNSIVLNWIDNSGNETYFDLRRSTSQYGTFAIIATLPANTTTYTNTGLTNNKKYYYKVRANNSIGNSAYSNSASAKAYCTTLKSGEFADCDYLKPSEAVTESIILFPNPVYGEWFNLNLSPKTKFPITVSMNSITGQKIFQKELNDYNNVIEINGLKNGMYIVTVQGKGDIHRLKLQIHK